MCAQWIRLNNLAKLANRKMGSNRAMRDEKRTRATNGAQWACQDWRSDEAAHKLLLMVCCFCFFLASCVLANRTTDYFWHAMRTLA